MRCRQVFEFCLKINNPAIRFLLNKLNEDGEVNFDLVMVIDMIKLVENDLGFLRKLKSQGYSMYFLSAGPAGTNGAKG